MAILTSGSIRTVTYVSFSISNLANLCIDNFESGLKVENDLNVQKAKFERLLSEASTDRSWPICIRWLI